MPKILLSALVILASMASGLAATQKLTSQKLTSIFENSTPDFQYTFVSNIGDGRGDTFGFVGFTSGTYSGTLFLEEYQSLNPNNALVAFLPIFRRIDAGPHDRAGRNPDTAGLEGFPAAFVACGSDPSFQTAQRILVNKLSWNPAVHLARTLGARYPLTIGELYDAYVNHGEDGVNSLVRKTNRRCKGTPKSGVPEKRWLATFLRVRLAVLSADATWVHALDRITVYQTLLSQRKYKLRLPLHIDCYGNHFDLD